MAEDWAEAETRVRRRGHRISAVIVAVIALLAGFALIAYPFVSDAIYQSIERGVVKSTANAVSSADELTLAEERQRALEYNERLLDGRAVVTDPFDPDAERPNDEDYNITLNLSGDGIMGTISIPKIQIELPIYHTTDDSVLSHGVGHLQGTSLPIGGDSSHCVLSGHTGLPRMKIFDNLDQLEVGDYFVISVLGEDHAYRVTSVEVVLPDETDSLVIEQGRDLCTLVTCTPYGVNTHRLLVRGHRVANDPADLAVEADAVRVDPLRVVPFVAAPVLVALFVIVLLRTRKRASSRATDRNQTPLGAHFDRKDER